MDINETYIYNNTNFVSLEHDITPMKSHPGFCPVLPKTTNVIEWIVVGVGFPLTILAIYSLYSQVKDSNVTPLFVINLLISDLILLCCLAAWLIKEKPAMPMDVSTLFFYYSVLVSVNFMMCIALERFLVIACPLWYHFKRNIQFFVCVSVCVWVLGFFEGFLVMQFVFPCHFIFLLLPFPVFILCLVGTFKSLSSAISVSLKEKCRIIGTLVLVLLIYTLLFMPWVICKPKYLQMKSDDHSALHLPFLMFSPIADLGLYVFMRKGAVDRLLACTCCCRRTAEEQPNQVTPTNNTVDNSVEIEQGI
ncbi:G-protein coupled receptor 4-like [Channa argus]|uniref:G-protein coupled receptor 4-like n=1 Tax=Channa argus TaxID=215402 RepID=UPI00351FE437